ncbi:hypothetical protein FACS1894166_02640 [Bacilli bacterium]|nr:hypothetical protein FACS1894166_02640 [Bacilli bacterium]
MKMYFILFSAQLDEHKQIAIKQLIIKHGGQVSGKYFEINDLSFNEVLRILKFAPYNVVCEEQQSTKIMKLGNKPPIPPTDPFVRRSELKMALKPYVTKSDLKTALKPYVTKSDLKVALAPIKKSLADIVSVLNVLNLRLDQNGLKPYVKQ